MKIFFEENELYAFVESVNLVSVDDLRDFFGKFGKPYIEPKQENSKHPNYTNFIGAYKTYHEVILKRPFTKINGGDGKALNLIIDEILKHTGGDYQKALEGWQHILIECAKLNEFLTSQTLRLTTFQKYLSEIIRKTTVKNEGVTNDKRGGKYAN
jgi:hypothetical protein